MRAIAAISLAPLAVGAARPACAAAMVATATALMCSQGYAQTPHHVLRGLSKIDLVVEELDSGAKQCGLSERAIRDAVMYPLSSTELALDSSSHEVLYINIQTIYL